MTAFDSPLLISKPVCLHARPTANRSFSYSEQRLVSTLLERRRRKYLKLLADSGKNEQSNELERKGDRSEIVSNLRVDESSAGSSTEMQPRRRLSPAPAVYETRFRHASIELVSEVMLPTKTRIKAKNLRSQSFHNDLETHCYKESSVLNKLDCSELADHVVHRAKVRLKKRQRRNLPSLKTNSPGLIPASSSPPPSSLSKPKTTTTLKQQEKFNNEVHQSNLKAQAALFSKRTDVISRSTTISSLGRQLDLMEGVNSSSSSSPLTTRSLKVVYWSDRQSATPKDTGIPNVPPATPNTPHSQCFKFVPSMSDVKSQRQLRNRLQDIIASKLKQKSELLNDEIRSKEEEKRRRREAIARLKAQQRSEIYALNKFMAEFEEQKFQAFLSGKV